jgi:hypothetical protein
MGLQSKPEPVGKVGSLLEVRVAPSDSQQENRSQSYDCEELNSATVPELER